MDFNDLFDKYEDLGFKTIPIAPGSKKCLIEEWPTRKFSTGTMFRGFGIGVVCGSDSGIVALDIDNDKMLDKCPLSPVSRRGSKGAVRFFKYNGEVSCKRKDLDLELFSNNNSQVLLPPTIHKDTKLPYVWLTPDTLLDFNKNDLPTIPEDFLNMLYDRVSVDKEIEIKKSNGTRCNHNSHNKLSEMMIAALMAGDTPDLIVENLIKYDEKINEILSYFLCPTRKWRSDNKIVNAYSFVVEAMKNHKDKITAPVKVTIGKQQQNVIEIEENDKQEEIDELKFPKLDGIAQDIFEYIYNRSPIKRSRFSWISSLSTMSMLISNKYAFDLGIGTIPILGNIYSLIICNSGEGKDFPLKVPADILNCSGLGYLVGQNRYVSDAAVIATLPTQRERFDELDEGSTLFASSKSASASEASIIHELSRIYSSSGQKYAGATRQKDIDKNINERRGACFSPYITFLTAITPEGLRQTFDSSSLEMGLASRIWFINDIRHKERLYEISSKNWDEEKKCLIDKIKKFNTQWHKNNIINADPKIDNIIPDRNYRVLVPENKSFVIDILNSLTKHFPFNENKNYRPIVSRIPEHFAKLALLMECSLQRNSSFENDFKISDKSLLWAESAVKILIKHGIEAVNNYACRSELHNFMTKVYDIIDSKGQNGISNSELMMKTRFIKSKQQYYEITSILSESGKILSKEFKTTRPGKRLFSAKQLTQ